MKIYVKAKSKKEINERIASGRTVTGENFSIFGDGGAYSLDENLPAGTVIAVYDKMSMGSPVSKSFGTWDGKKVK
jgi:hypothetical protein